ncbi:MAG: hypothetical protein CMP23_05335 [Rickettsiales bacterium]|nr:hypothetical protein [Rickettsiales bacterium]
MEGSRVGLQARVTLLVVGLVILVQAGWGLSVMRANSNLMRAEAERRGIQMLKALAAPCAVALANREIETLDAILASFTEEDLTGLDLISISILSAEGKVFAHTDPSQYGKQANDPFEETAMISDQQVELRKASSGEPLLLLSMPIVAGLRWGTATAVLSLAPVERQIYQHSRRVLLLSALFSALVGLLLSSLLQRSILRPLDRLTNTAKSIAKGQLDARVPPLERGDEMAMLGDVFNEMVEQVEGQTRVLEGKVAERTYQLRQTNLELQSAVAQLEQLARTDALTGLDNHRAFQEALAFEIDRAQRTGSPLSLMMIDVDHFKSYNDTHGHPGGDRVLRTVGKLLRNQLRSIDRVARYGGEEFVVLLLETDAIQAELVGEKLRIAIEKEKFAGEEVSQPGGRLTISAGLASFPRQATTGEALLDLADAALYRAKHGGRNQVWRDRSRDQ